ncbi:MAG: hypothetical protein KME14_20285 [Tildeniella torsiva UHER 1998/13D]|jgi:hypothetical protein|nr:hypothetical protein [Tildeniella torsiva UHER 1998/13D]
MSLATTVNDLRSLRTQVLINNGTDDLDVSPAFETLQLSTEVWGDRAWFAPRGTLRLAAYVDGFTESFDCRVNPSRWAPRNTVAISLWFGSWVPLPWPLKILRYPNRPYPGNRFIDLELGTDADLLNYRAPEGDPSGIEYGTSTSATFLVNAALAKAGAPALTDSIAGLALPFSPGKNQGGSWMTYAGQVAYAGGYVLWQQADGDVRATPLTTEGLAPFAHYVVGRDEADYVPETAQESPPEDVRVTGTTYSIDSVGNTSNVTVDTVDGVTVRTTVTYADRDTTSPTYTELVEQPANVVLPAIFPSTTSLITESELTRDWDYASITSRLTSEVETIRRPVAAIFPNSLFGTPTALAIETRRTIAYTYDAESTVIARQTTLERAVISGVTVTTAIAQITIERWEKVGAEEYTYSRTQVNRDGSISPLPQRRGASTNNTPPATQYRPAEKQRTERQVSGTAKFTSPAGSGFAEKLWAITLPAGMGVSHAQCRDRAKLWGSIRQGRQFAIAWAADLAQGWLEDFTPVRRVDFTVDGRRTAYLVEALNIAIDGRSAAIGGRGIELGLVSVDAPLPPPSAPGDPPTPDLPEPAPPFDVVLTGEAVVGLSVPVPVLSAAITDSVTDIRSTADGDTRITADDDTRTLPE